MVEHSPKILASGGKGYHHLCSHFVPRITISYNTQRLQGPLFDGQCKINACFSSRCLRLGNGQIIRAQWQWRKGNDEAFACFSWMSPYNEDRTNCPWIVCPLPRRRNLFRNFPFIHFLKFLLQHSLEGFVCFYLFENFGNQHTRKIRKKKKKKKREKKQKPKTNKKQLKKQQQQKHVFLIRRHKVRCKSRRPLCQKRKKEKQEHILFVEKTILTWRSGDGAWLNWNELIVTLCSTSNEALNGSLH